MRILDVKEIQAMQLELMKKLHAYLTEKGIPYYMIAGSALGALRHGGFIPWDDDIDIAMFRSDYEKFLNICDDFDRTYDIVNYRNREHCDFCLTRIYFPNTKIVNQSIENTRLDKRMYFDIFPLDNAPEDAAARSALEHSILDLKRKIYLADVRDYNNTAAVIFLKKMRALLYTSRRQKLLARCDELMQSYDKCRTTCVCSMCSQYSFERQTMPRAYYGKPTLRCFEDTEFFLPEQAERYLEHLYGADYAELPPESKRRKCCEVYLLSED